MSDGRDERFLHPPKKIDTALVSIAITLLIQTGAGVWWAATTNSRIEKLEENVAPVRVVIETVARLDERTKGIERIERKLDALEERR